VDQPSKIDSYSTATGDERALTVKRRGKETAGS
jgi:hypothetical protein